MVSFIITTNLFTLYIVVLCMFIDTFTCAAARLSPGCCQGTSCTVYSRNRSCYCDRFCILFNDCCRDVQERTALNCTNRVSVSC